MSHPSFFSIASYICTYLLCNNSENLTSAAQTCQSQICYKANLCALHCITSDMLIQQADVSNCRSWEHFLIIRKLDSFSYDNALGNTIDIWKTLEVAVMRAIKSQKLSSIWEKQRIKKLPRNWAEIVTVICHCSILPCFACICILCVLYRRELYCLISFFVTPNN